MSSQLTDEELAALMPSELVQYQTPIPTQIVASDEFYPDPQNDKQREVENRLLAMADDLGQKQVRTSPSLRIGYRWDFVTLETRPIRRSLSVLLLGSLFQVFLARHQDRSVPVGPLRTSTSASHAPSSIGVLSSDGSGRLM
jgi:hypothetical protein